MIKCPSCKKNRQSKTYYLIPCDENIQEVLQKGYCKECQKNIAILKITLKNGDKQTKIIRQVDKFLNRKTIDYIEEKQGTWKKAKGFRYFIGSKRKNSTKGALYKLSDDSKEIDLELPYTIK